MYGVYLNYDGALACGRPTRCAKKQRNRRWGELLVLPPASLAMDGRVANLFMVRAGQMGRNPNPG